MTDAESNDKAKAREAWCHREYISEKDCDKWVADQLARREARKEDEERRRQDRLDDEARRQEERSEHQTHQEAPRQQDSHSDETQKTSDSSSSDSGSSARPTLLLAALADTQTNATGKTDAKGEAEAAARAAWCHEEYVSEKDCDEWVADQLARRAAREADERKRKQDRHEDEAHRREERHEDEARRKQDRHADDTATKTVFAGPTMMLATTQDSTNSSVHLTEDQQHQLDAILAKLRKRAAHEEKYAAEDGEDAVEFFKEEYARKEERAIAKFMRKVAADAEKANASHAVDGPSANLTKGRDAKTDPNAKPLVADMLTIMVAAPDSEALDAQLNEEQQQQLESILAKLRKQAEHEEKYAMEDGEAAVNFFKNEYARKEEHAIAEFKRKAATAVKKDAAGDVVEQRNATAANKADVILPGAAANLVAVAAPAAPISTPAGQAASQAPDGAGKMAVADHSEEAEAHEAWCHREYVSKKDCEKWVADQLARRAARKADEEKRRQARREDEARRQEERAADEARRRQDRHEDAAHAEAPRNDAAHKTEDASKGDAAKQVVGSEVKPGAKPAEKDAAGDAAGKPSAKATKTTDVDLRGAATNLVAVAAPAAPISTPAGQAASQEPEGAGKRVVADRSDEAKAHEAWCHREYVSEKDCEKWVADQLARRAARKADEEKRRQARHEDEARRQEERGADESRRRQDRREDAAHAKAPRNDAAHKTEDASKGDVPKKVAGSEVKPGAKPAKKDAAGDAAGKPSAKPTKMPDVDLHGAATNLVAVAAPAAPASAPAGQAASQAPEGAGKMAAAGRSDEAKAHEAWCHREYVSEKNCEKWVADQLARRAARKADEEKRRQARHEDEARRQEERDADEARRRQERHEDMTPTQIPRDRAAQKTESASRDDVVAKKAVGSDEPGAKPTKEDATSKVADEPSAKATTATGTALRGATANLAAFSTSMDSLSLLSLAAMASSAAAVAYLAKGYRIRRIGNQEPLLG